MTTTDGRDAAYHDAHINDPEEWDLENPEEATVKPSGMTVFSLRFPVEELAAIRTASAAQGVTVSDFIRAAIRAHFTPSPPWAAVSASSATDRFTFSLTTPLWIGGGANRRVEADVREEPLPTGTGGG